MCIEIKFGNKFNYEFYSVSLFVSFICSPFGRWAVCLILVFVVLTSLSVGGYFIFQSEASHDTEPTAKDLSAVVTNGYECSKIAR